MLYLHAVFTCCIYMGLHGLPMQAAIQAELQEKSVQLQRERDAALAACAAFAEEARHPAAPLPHYRPAALSLCLDAVLPRLVRCAWVLAWVRRRPLTFARADAGASRGRAGGAS